MAEGGKKKVYRVTSQLFFASVTDFVADFNFKENIEIIELDLSHAHLWDDSAVGAIDKVVLKYQESGKTVLVSGLNEDSSSLIEKRATYKKENAKLANH